MQSDERPIDENRPAAVTASLLADCECCLEWKRDDPVDAMAPVDCR